MKKLIFCMFLTMFSLVACFEDKFDNLEVVNITLGEDTTGVELTDYYSKMSVIPLHEDSVMPLDNVSRVLKHDGKYYVCDQFCRNIQVFDEQGKRLKCFNRYGHGHNEYLSICNFEIIDNKIYILIYPSKLLITDLDFKIISDVKFGEEHDITGMCVYNDVIYLYSSVTSKLSYLTEDNEVKEIMETQHCNMVPKPRTVFHKTSLGLIYAPEPCDTFYLIKNVNAIKPIFAIDYKGKQESIERYKIPKVLSFEELLKYDCPKIHSIIETKDNLLIEYTFYFAVGTCVISKSDLSLVKDGPALTYGPIMSVSSGKEALGGGFYRGKEDTLTIQTDKYKTEFKSEPDETGNNIIVEYHE